VAALHDRLFPTLTGAKWAEVNLNEEALKTAAPSQQLNPLLDPDTQHEFVLSVAKARKADFTFGGYLEWRGDLLRGCYMNPDEMCHLGIDYNVPAGTPVALPADAVLVDVKKDMDQALGWGGRLLFHRPAEDLYFVLGHLVHADLLAPHLQGTSLRRGARVGTIGEMSENGGCFPHLHIQCLSAAEYAAMKDCFDGYGARSSDLPHRYPSPLIALAAQA
jgi:Peptidase family M23